MGSKGNRRKGTETFLTGLVLAAGFGAAWYFHQGWFWVFPMMFAGVIPAVKGIQMMISERGERKSAPENNAGSAEKEILRVAKEEGGTVTPALVALKSSLTTEKAEEILQFMAKRNFVTMNITTDGRVEYEFPEFKRRIE